ncbi:MAG: hypothetical protein E7D71_06150 [Varibaculum cambriense]|nr:hypothetical protein [Varibaculum cambriense]
MNTFTAWVKTHKPHTAGIVIALLAVIALSAAWATGVFSTKSADTASSEPAITAEVPAGTKKTPVKIDVSADEKVTEESTPAIVRVQSTDERAKPVDFYHAVDSGKKTSTVEVSPGDYKVTVTGVINNDGSVAKPAKESKEIAVSIKSTDKKADADNKANVGVNLDKTIPADKVTADDVKEIADTTKTAVENGDKSLKGDAGKAILGKVDTNTKANTHLSGDAKANVTESTEKAKASTETKAKTTVTDAPKSANKPSTPSAPKPTTKDKPAPKAKTWVPEKGHWENTTQKVWVPKVVTVTTKPAWNEKVETGTKYVFSDGYTTYSNAERRAYSKRMLQAGTPVSYTWYPEYKTVHHPAVTHTEDRGHYENKVTGRKWVVDVPGHYK